MGSDIVCWILSGTDGWAGGGEGVPRSTRMVMSAASPESELGVFSCAPEGPATLGGVSLFASLLASDSSLVICCQSSHGSSTSASRSAAARQFGQTKIGY